MGNSESSSETKNLPKATSGFLGGDRMVEHYKKDVVRVDHLTGPVLAKELSKRCGDEGSKQRSNLDDAGNTTLRFLKEAIFFLPDAMSDGADMKNTAFIFAQPGSEFVIMAGAGDWEFYFAERADGNIYVQGTHIPLKWYIWNKVTMGCKWVVGVIFAVIVQKVLTAMVNKLN